MAVEQLVSIAVGWSLTAHVSGIRRCSSPWCCPLCSPAIGQRRAVEIDQAVAEQLDRGGSIVLVTFTVRHHAGDRLAPRLDAITEALTKVLQGSAWKRRRDRLDYRGAIRSIEVTYSANGWHPHNHALLFFGQRLDAAAVEDLRQWLFARWDREVTRRGFGTLDRRHGVDVQVVTKTGQLGGYLSKLGEGWSAGLELTRADLKTGRAGSLTPWALLAEAADTGDMAPLQLWQEYEEATRGKRPIRWSPGLRAELLGSEREVSDEEAAAAEALDARLVEVAIRRAVWTRHLLAATTGQLLTDVERGAALVLALVQLTGGELRPLDRGGSPWATDDRTAVA